MIDLDDTFVADSTVHARNLTPDNVRIREEAKPILEMMVQGTRNNERGPILTEKSVRRDWTIEDTAKLAFAEGFADVATYHPTPIAAFKDGLSALEKAKEAVDRWPDRFNVMASIDPLKGETALNELEEQVELLDPIGLKLYPYGWPHGRDMAKVWSMDDQDIAYPVIEKAKKLGLKFIAVHKAVPLGRAPISGADPSDMDIAAQSFPEINFCIVHGGLSFLESTAWQLFNFDNIYVDLEGAAYLAVNKKRRLAEILMGLVERGGEDLFNKIFWGSGIPPRVHPQIQYDAFVRFEIPDDIQERYGVTLEDKHKKWMIGDNYAEMAGIDKDEQRKCTKNDEFEGLKAEFGGRPEPYSTIDDVEVECWL